MAGLSECSLDFASIVEQAHQIEWVGQTTFDSHITFTDILSQHILALTVNVKSRLGWAAGYTYKSAMPTIDVTALFRGVKQRILTGADFPRGAPGVAYCYEAFSKFKDIQPSIRNDCQ